MPVNPQSHERHDRYLVAALAADDLEPAVRPEAEALVASCADCAELLADLRTIAAATHALPPVPRRRDFTISAADAARLRPTGWRALLDAIGGARASFSRPLAVGLTTLGLAGILVTTIPGALTGGFGAFGSAASTPQGPEAAAPSGTRDLVDANVDGAGKASAAPAPISTSAAPSAAATSGADYTTGSPAPSPAIVQAAPSASQKAVSAGGVPTGLDSGSTGSPRDGAFGPQAGDGSRVAGGGGGGPAPLLLVSLALLVGGLALFLARWAARRVGLG
jgi:hypothetical protein